MKRSILFALVLLLAGWGMVSSRVLLDEYRVDTDNNDLLVIWKASVEQDVTFYVVKRLTRFTNNEFREIAQVVAQGPNKRYVYRDDAIYKTQAETVEYQIEAVATDGSRTTFSRLQIAYTPTAVRRTWGSIKAMFQ